MDYYCLRIGDGQGTVHPYNLSSIHPSTDITALHIINQSITSSLSSIISILLILAHNTYHPPFPTPKIPCPSHVSHP